MIDLSTNVFSCFGSHLSVFAMHENAQNANRGKAVEKDTGKVLSDVGLTPGFYFRNFVHRRDYASNLFEIATPDTGKTCPAYTCLPEKLTVSGEHGFEVCYATAETLLIRPHGQMQLRCKRLRGERSVSGTSFLLEDPANRYALRITGDVAVRVAGNGVVIDVTPGGMVRVDEHDDVMPPQQSVPAFDDCAAARRAEYEAFLAKLPKPLEGDETLMQLAAYCLWSAVAFARGNYKRDCMLVSKNYMCGMWSWDHCFAAMALSLVSPERAWDQLMCMFDEQRADGRIPDCIEAVKMEWGYLKPPIHGLALDVLSSHMTLTRAQMEEAYDRLKKWTLFWLEKRDIAGDGLPQHLHGNDSGWDNNSVFDGAVPVQSPEVPAYLALMMRRLARLADALGLPEGDMWLARAETLKAAMLRELFVNGLPIARTADTHEQVGRWSALPFMAITLGDALPEEIRASMMKKLDDPNFLTPYGIASEALDSPLYQLDGYSRGSIWSYGQFLPVTGLLRMGETAAARRIMEGFLSCCRKGGFSECFCSKNGEGQRDRCLNWSVCVYVLFTAWLQKDDSELRL